jgi:hypothetical protein
MHRVDAAIAYSDLRQHLHVFGVVSVDINAGLRVA